MSTRAFGRLRYPVFAAASAAAIAASGLWSPSLHDLRIALSDGGRVEIGAARINGTWLGTALAQAADVTLENAAFEFGTVAIRLPRVEFSGAKLSRDELAALFDQRVAEPLAARLSRLSAREVRIPELRIEQVAGGTKQITIYRNVVARDIVDGRIPTLTSAGAALEVSGTPGARGTTGALSISNFDLSHAAALYDAKTGSTPAEMKTVYASFSLDDLRMSDDSGADIHIARMSGKEFRARPSGSWSETTRILGETQDLQKASPAERARLFDSLADLFDAYEIGSVEATGFEVRHKADQAAGRIARLTYTGGSPGRAADARAEGIEIGSTTGRVRMATIAFSGFSLKDTVQSMKMLGEKVADADLWRLAPAIGTVRISGLDFDGPADAKAAKPSPLRFGIANFEVTADKPVNGIPTNMRMAIENVAFAVPPDTKEEGLRDLAAMGYGNLDLSLVAAATWNEAGNEVVLREVSLRGAGMGSATLRGILGNVGKDAFNPDSAIAAVALLGATARQVEIAIENKGLFERVIAQEARKQKRSPEDLRREYGMAAAVAVPAVLGNSASAKAVGQAIARFVVRPGRLTVSARARDSAGLGLSDIAGTTEPAALLDKLEITATAE